MANEKQSIPSSGGSSQGPATDASNVAVVDPSSNVMALVEAANKRQDDLRHASEKYCSFEVAHVKESALQNAIHDRELRSMEERYTQQLREAEAKRIDAIRAVDVNAVSVAAERSAAQATVLANQVSQSADTLRTLVASTAATVAQGQQALAQALGDRITKLEQAQYTGAGRASFADPQMEALLSQMKALTSANATGTGKSQGVSMVASVIIGVAIFASAVIAVIGFIMK